MTLISYYDPTSTVWCPKCKKVVTADMLSGVVLDYPWRFSMRCRECKHEWSFKIGEERRDTWA
jgi:hypothetical protein